MNDKRNVSDGRIYPYHASRLICKLLDQMIAHIEYTRDWDAQYTGTLNLVRMTKLCMMNVIWLSARQSHCIAELTTVCEQIIISGQINNAEVVRVIHMTLTECNASRRRFINRKLASLKTSGANHQKAMLTWSTIEDRLREREGERDIERKMISLFAESIDLDGVKYFILCGRDDEAIETEDNAGIDTTMTHEELYKEWL